MSTTPAELLPSEIVSIITARMTSFEVFYQDGELPITEEDAPYNKKLREEFDIRPVPFAAGLYIQAKMRTNLLACTINSGVYQHFLAALEYHLVATPESILCNTMMWDVVTIPSRETLAYLRRMIGLLVRHHPEKVKNVQLIYAPEIIRDVLAAASATDCIEDLLSRYRIEDDDEDPSETARRHRVLPAVVEYVKCVDPELIHELDAADLEELGLSA